MDIQNFIKEWISVSNSYDTAKYQEFYHEDALIDDPSVGQKFEGRKGIKNYFESYFIDYKTQTKVVLLTLKNSGQAHLEVEFTWSFPEGTIGGTFDLIFKNGKIIFLKADLL